MSTDFHKRALIPIPDIQLGTQFGRLKAIAGIGGAFLMLLYWSAAFFFKGADKGAEFFQSYLFAYLYWVGFSFGGLGILLLNNTVGGRWGVSVRSFLIAAARTLPLMAVLFIPFWFGMGHIWPWADPYQLHHSATLWHKQGYLNKPFFWGRAVFYFGLFIFFTVRLKSLSDRQDAGEHENWPVRFGRLSAPWLLIFTFMATFAYIDWILSASVEFFSTVYGAMLVIANVLQTFALTITVLIMASKGDRFGGRVNKVLLHDLGNMMFAFMIFWTYLAASQLIIIWPADLPQEIMWYLVRVKGGWRVIAAIISLVMFAIPFLALLSQARKQNPRRLMRVAIWIMIARVIDTFWIVEPTFRQTGFYVTWTDFAAFFGVGGLWLYFYLDNLGKRPLLPLRDPRVSPILPEEAVVA